MCSPTGLAAGRRALAYPVQVSRLQQQLLVVGTLGVPRDLFVSRWDRLGIFVFVGNACAGPGDGVSGAGVLRVRSFYTA